MHEEDFLKAMQQDAVEPLKKKSDRLAVNKAAKKTTDSDISLHNRRLAAAGETNRKLDPLSSMPKELLAPFDELSFARPGMQHGVFKNLRLGKYNVDAQLDLHRHTVAEARKSLYQFILDCQESGIRTVLVSHGTGAGRAKPALLKSCVNHWLPQLDAVLAFHTAQKHHGGYGATYVLLKKGSKEKLKTKKQHER